MPKNTARSHGTPTTATQFQAVQSGGLFVKVLGSALATMVGDALNVTAAKYTPTPVSVANVASFSTTYEHIYFRLGSYVLVGGAQRYTPTGAGTTQIGIPLPIASNLVANDGRGLVSSANGVFTRGNTAADAANDRVDVYETVTAGTIHDVVYAFWYEIKA